jgi:hypothetical protein
MVFRKTALTPRSRNFQMWTVVQMVNKFTFNESQKVNYHVYNSFLSDPKRFDIKFSLYVFQQQITKTFGMVEAEIHALSSLALYRVK